MENTYKIERETLMSVQRAYLVFDGIAILKINKVVPGGTDILQFTPNWENPGNTPATPVVGRFFTDGLSDEPNEEEFVGPTREQVIFEVGPRAHWTGNITSLPESTILGARVGSSIKKKIFAWGWVAYKDVLPNTKPHLTEICFHLSQIYSSLPMRKINTQDYAISPKSTPGLTWEGCQEHNCVDTYCKDYKAITDLLPNQASTPPN